MDERVTGSSATRFHDAHRGGSTPAGALTQPQPIPLTISGRLGAAIDLQGQSLDMLQAIRDRLGMANILEQGKQVASPGIEGAAQTLEEHAREIRSALEAILNRL